MAQILLIVEDWQINMPTDLILGGKSAAIQMIAETLIKNGHLIKHVVYDDFVDASTEDLANYSIIILGEEHSLFIQNALKTDSRKYVCDCLVGNQENKPDRPAISWDKAYFIIRGQSSIGSALQVIPGSGKLITYADEEHIWNSIAQLLSPRTQAIREFSAKQTVE